MSELPQPEIDIDVSHVKVMNNGDIVFHVAAANPNCDKLEVDHSYGKGGQFGDEYLLPNFNVYANTFDPYGNTRDEYNNLGIKVTYRNYVWSITILNKGRAANIIREHGNGILEMKFVIYGLDEQKSGSMKNGTAFVLTAVPEQKDEPAEVEMYYVYKNSDKVENTGKDLVQFVTRSPSAAKRLSIGLNGGGRPGTIVKHKGYIIDGQLYTLSNVYEPKEFDLECDVRQQMIDEAMGSIVDLTFTESDIELVQSVLDGRSC